MKVVMGETAKKEELENTLKQLDSTKNQVKLILWLILYLCPFLY